MLEFVWKFKSIDDAAVESVATEFKLPPVIARIMALRGITDRTISRSFFYPEQEALHDPFLMKDMEKAVQRIRRQLDEHKTMLVFGDYDVDGTTGTSMFYLFIKSLGGDIQYYIPNRENEGYGMSNKGIDYAHTIGADLLITCDCGINACEHVEYANSLGIDVIITDHHSPEPTLPPALAILNPKQVDCPYPFKGLCGAGVIFKLAMAIARSMGIDEQLVWQHSDLVALGIAADLVPIVDENRIIVNHGLQLIESQEKPGIAALLRESGMADKEITVGRMVFWLAPKINAAGRLGDAGRAVKLLTTNASMFAREMAQQLEQENRRRQDITMRMEEQAIQQVHKTCDLTRDKAIVLGNRGWHTGVVGIVASRIKEIFYRPTFIISIDEAGMGKGSGRSINGFDLYEALTACQKPLTGFGGHPMAAGLTVTEDQLPVFREAFLAYADQNIRPEDLQPVIHLDGELPIGEIDARFLKFLKALSPYGPRNMRPKFLSRKLRVKGIPKLLGRDNSVLKFQVQEHETIFDAIGFKMTENYEKLLTGKPIDIVYEVGENEWNGRKTIQLEVKDIKVGDRDNA